MKRSNSENFMIFIISESNEITIYAECVKYEKGCHLFLKIRAKKVNNDKIIFFNTKNIFKLKFKASF